MTPVTLRLTFDGGWTDGDPGRARLRFNHPSPARATELALNLVDATGAEIGDVMPWMLPGSVVTIERVGSPANVLVAMIIGRPRHGGSHYVIPIHVRSVSGSLAAADALTVEILREQPADDGQPEPAVPSVRVVPDPAAELADLRRQLAAANQGREQLEAVLSGILSDSTPVTMADE